MSELKPCDFLDNEIFVGDEVAFFALGYRMFTRGTVVKITNKCLFIDYDNSWNYDHHEEHTRQEQRQVIDLTALNRHAQSANEPLMLSIEAAADAIDLIERNGGCPPDKDCAEKQDCHKCHIEWLTSRLTPKEAANG